MREPTRSPLSQAQVIVGVTVHNNAGSIRRCLESVLEQKTEPFTVATLVLDDFSTDDWMDVCMDFLTELDAGVLTANCGSASGARNGILDYVETSLPVAKWVARLDGDDRFSTSDSLRSMCDLASSSNAEYVLGGNRLVQDSALIRKTNPATQSLFREEVLLDLLGRMAAGTAVNELPSCNLLLSPRSGWRYPEARSAEDHWLVASLLIHHRDRGAILESGFYCDYSLGGPTTQACRASGAAKLNRTRLYEAAQKWIAAKSWPGKLLGYGYEGVVLSIDGNVEKHFFSWPLTDDHVRWLQTALTGCAPYLPEARWEKRGEAWVAVYGEEDTTEVRDISRSEAEEFLSFCLQHRIVCKNIRRSNFRRRAGGGLLYVDLGESIMPMDVDYFRDSAARLYAISVLGWPDEELRRRRSNRRQTDILRDIDGFEQFYAGLLEARAAALWESSAGPAPPCPGALAADVTLMIKTCPMDARLVRDQARHIVVQLESPTRFHEKLLLIDPHEGPYLRAYAAGDLPRLLSEAQALVEESVVDRVLVAPADRETAERVNETWFGIRCGSTHNAQGVPLVPQLWGFDQVRTRYLLQCDVDILVGRRDYCHDYLAEMIEAVQPPDVLGAAFNIPHAPDAPKAPYSAEPGDYVPEVRCGLLDLDRLRSHRPYPNSMQDDNLLLPWYRSVQRYQQEHGLMTLRGGDPATFYVHPTQEHKKNSVLFARIRDLVGQGRVPPVQHDQWDLQGTTSDWDYPRRAEEVVFLLRGRATPAAKVGRCVSSLVAQDDQNFGVIVIDDASGPSQSMLLARELGPLWDRTTLICNDKRRGHIANTIAAVSEVCSDPATLVVILDQDDALMDARAVGILRGRRAEGHDVILAAMYRPDKPMKVYHPDFNQPRATYGGEVWIHLRAFKKSLFDLLPRDVLKIGGEWVPSCEDYAIMVPLVELASSPTYVPTYFYYHERSTPRDAATRRQKDAIIRAILEKGFLTRDDAL